MKVRQEAVLGREEQWKNSMVSWDLETGRLSGSHRTAFVEFGFCPQHKDTLCDTLGS